MKKEVKKKREEHEEKGRKKRPTTGEGEQEGCCFLWVPLRAAVETECGAGLTLSTRGSHHRQGLVGREEPTCPDRGASSPAPPPANPRLLRPPRRRRQPPTRFPGALQGARAQPLSLTCGNCQRPGGALCLASAHGIENNTHSCVRQTKVFRGAFLQKASYKSMV